MACGRATSASRLASKRKWRPRSQSLAANLGQLGGRKRGGQAAGALSPASRIKFYYLGAGLPSELGRPTDRPARAREEGGRNCFGESFPKRRGCCLCLCLCLCRRRAALALAAAASLAPHRPSAAATAATDTAARPAKTGAHFRSPLSRRPNPIGPAQPASQRAKSAALSLSTVRVCGAK